MGEWRQCKGSGLEDDETDAITGQRFDEGADDCLGLREPGVPAAEPAGDGHGAGDINGDDDIDALGRELGDGESFAGAGEGDDGDEDGGDA